MLEKIKYYLLLSIAFFFRIYRVDQVLAFHYDQGRDALVIWDLIHKGKLFLIGPTTGIAGIFRGPFYYYLITPFYFLGRGNPIWPAIFLAVTSVIALGLMYYLAKKIGGSTAAIIALILGGFSFETIYASRWLSNPTPMLLLSMILVWSLFKIYEGHKKYWAVTSLVLGLSLFHFGSSGEIFYFPAVLIFAIWQRKNLPNRKTLLLSAILFALTILPLALFDFRHGGILEGNIKGFLLSGGSFSFAGWIFVLDRLNAIGHTFSQLLYHNPLAKESAYLLAIGIASIYFLPNLIKNDRFKILFILLTTSIVGLVFFSGNFGNFYSYYLTGYFLMFLLAVALVLGYLFDKYSVGKVLVIIFIFSFLSWNLNNIKSYVETTGTEETAIVLATQRKAIEWIYQNTGDRNFNVDEYVPPVIPYSYQYLFKWLNNPNLVDTQVPLLFTLSEIDPPHPERLKAWQERQAGIGKVIKEERFGGIIVQERERIVSK